MNWLAMRLGGIVSVDINLHRTIADLEDRSEGMMGLANILLIALGAIFGFAIAWLLVRPNAAVLNTRLSGLAARAGESACRGSKIH